MPSADAPTMQVGVEVKVFGELGQALRALLFAQPLELVGKDCENAVSALELTLATAFLVHPDGCSSCAAPLLP